MMDSKVKFGQHNFKREILLFLGICRWVDRRLGHYRSLIATGREGIPEGGNSMSKERQQKRRIAKTLLSATG
jgi:hypothetical protein